MTSTRSDERIVQLLRKIRALRAKAESSGTTEAESAAFAAKAAEMLAAHGLEEAQLAVDEQTGIGHESGPVDWSDSPARRLMASAVCRLYGVKPLIVVRKSTPWTLIGRKGNVVMAVEMTACLIKATKRLSSEWGRANRGGNTIDFRRGCFQRLSERLVELRKRQEESEAPVYSPSGNPGNLPALFQQEKSLITAYKNAHFRTRRISMSAGRIGDAAQEGRRAGDGVSLHRQVSGGGGGGLLISRR